VKRLLIIEREYGCGAGEVGEQAAIQTTFASQAGTVPATQKALA
jgi:hypothetical protein